MKKSDLDTVTNVILNNENKLHENEEIKEDTQKIVEDKDNKKENKLKDRKKRKKKKTLKQKILLILKIFLGFILFIAISIFLFFKTPIFQKYKEIWVATAMSTMNHQYLATWFLSDKEIEEILKKLEVVNNEDSNIDDIVIDFKIDEAELQEKITIEKITGKNYVGYVMIIPNPSKVKLVESRKKYTGTQLSEIVKDNNAIAGINAGGFKDDGGVGKGNLLCKATILDKKLLYGYENTKYSLIGLSSDKKLVLGNYTYQQALDAGIESAIEFGPFIIVNGKNQITHSSSGGIHPRTAIGQRKDGKFIFVVIDGRQPGYSIGTNFLELQNIFNRYDAYNAANLDGGSSSTMYYDGKVVNKASTPMGQRYLPNAFIVDK